MKFCDVVTHGVINSSCHDKICDLFSNDPYLYFSIAKGIYGKYFYSFMKHYTVNPFTLINFPTDSSFNTRF